mgnify:CR=1 FL=1
METIDEKRKEFAGHIAKKLYSRLSKRGQYVGGDVESVKNSIEHLLRKENWIPNETETTKSNGQSD